MTNNTSGFEILSYATIGFGTVRGTACTLADAKSSAEMMTTAANRVLVVRSRRSDAEYALIRGSWVRNPDVVDIVAATSRIDDVYARGLWTYLADAAADAGKIWWRGSVDCSSYTFTDRTSF